MDIIKTAKRLEGLQTVSTVSKIEGISRRTAINYISTLRKRGLAKTIHGGRGVRMYKISPAARKEEGIDFYEEMNRYSKVKIMPSYSYNIHEKRIEAEDLLVRAVETGRFRVVLASLGLFAHIKNWPRLGKTANGKGIGRKIGALYDAARRIIKVRRMDERTRKSLLRNKMKGNFIIENLKSDDLKDIEKEWDVHLPFNIADLKVYKE